MAESDTWEGKENLENVKKTVEEFEKEYQQDIKDVRKQKREEKTLKGENYQEGLQQRNYLGGQIRGMTKNIGKGQNGIGSNGKGEKEDKPWRQSQRKKKSSRKTQKSENGQKKMRKKQATWLTHIMSCKNPWDKET